MGLIAYIAKVKAMIVESDAAISLADEENHPGGWCPEDEGSRFCDWCIPRVVAAGDAYYILPWFVRAWFWIIHPIENWYGEQELKECRELMVKRGLTVND